MRRKLGETLKLRRIVPILAVVVLATTLLAVGHGSNSVLPKYQEFLDPDGVLGNLNLGGPSEESQNPFFQSMGTNGRSCVTCHQPSDAFSVTPPHLQQRFDFPSGGRGDLPDGGRSHPGRPAQSLQLAAEPGVDPHSTGGAGDGELPGGERVQPVWMQRHGYDFAVPAPAADDEPEFPERGDV
jgi:hypothetical protein